MGNDADNVEVLEAGPEGRPKLFVFVLMPFHEDFTDTY